MNKMIPSNFLNNPTIHRSISEYKAIISILQRSFSSLINVLNNEIDCKLKRHTNYKYIHLVDKKLIKNYLGDSRLYFKGSKSYFNKDNSDEKSRSSGNENEDDKDKKKKEDNAAFLAKASFYIAIGYIITTFAQMFFGGGGNQPDVVRYVSWNEFVHLMLAKGEVESLIVMPEVNIVTINLHDGAIIKGKLAQHNTYHMNIVNVDSFEHKLRKAERSLGIKPDEGVPVIYDRNDSNWFSIITLGIIAFIVYKMFKSGQIKSTPMSDIFSQMGRARFTLVEPFAGGTKGVRFRDVAGLQEAKVEIMEFVDYLKCPQKYKALGAKVPKGVLLLGPPGCGKTMLAKAVATESNVPFLAMAGSEFIEMIGGLGAARVRDLFKEATKRAPCIVYIDEIDAIGKKRSGQAFATSGEEEQTLNQLLVELDGMADREGIIVLASTNRHDVLDKALLRPGRFDRHILIDLPNIKERKEIFEQYISGLKISTEPELKPRSSRLSQLTPGMSGADIANVCNEAALHAAANSNKLIVAADFEYAVERIVGGREKRSSVMSPEEKRVVAHHECGHALIGWLLKYTDALLKVTIVPRTSDILGFAQYLPTDQKLYSVEELFEKMCMALGGRVAESLVFNKISSGAKDDLEKVTKMAYAQIKQFGMDETIGPISFPNESDEIFVGRRPYSKKLANTIDMQARLLVAKAYKNTENVLKENMDKLKLLAENLLEKEVLNYADVEKLIGPPPHGKKKVIEALDLGPLPEEPEKPFKRDNNGGNGDREVSKENKVSKKDIHVDV